MITLLPPDLLPAVTSEARKASTLRSNLILAGALPAAALVLSALTALISGPVDPKSDPVTGAASVGLYLAIAVTVVAAACYSASATGAEFRYGGFPLTVLFTGDRDRVVAAKYLVVGGTVLATAVVVELVGFLALLGVGRDKVEVGPNLFAVLGSGLLAAVCWSLIGAGLALLLRRAGTAVALILAWLLVVEPLVWVVAQAIGAGGLATLLPGSATIATVAVGSFPDSDILAPTPAALVVLLVWTILAAGAGWSSFRGRDL